MTAMIFQLLGGVGLFLMGVVLLTDGLKALVGDALNRALVRFTGTPYKAFASGALVTLMVQSSSATTMTLIGFVSAGLLTFPQAVGVVLGASLGATGTSWVVSMLGLKVSLGFYALPLVGIGALLRLLSHGRWRSLGLALAGFGLIFVGIDKLQNSMQDMAGIFDLATLPSTGVISHLVTVVIGILMTVIMQSSSAVVATTLTALHVNAVNFDQAATLVIGAAIGTTVTSALAASGGSVSAKRTALAHIAFNLVTGVIALLLLPAFLWGLAFAQQQMGLEPGAVSLAAFHTAFITLGVAIFLPFNRAFARSIVRLLPEQGPHLTRHLDDTLLQAPAVALESTRRTLIVTTLETISLLNQLLSSAVARVSELQRVEVKGALKTTQHFFARIPPITDDEPLSRSRIAQLHAIDHLARLLTRLNLSTATRKVMTQPALQSALTRCQKVLALARQGLLHRVSSNWMIQMERQAQALAELRRDERLVILRQTANGKQSPFDALEALDAIRWLERVTYHTWRLCHYLAEEIAENGEMEPPDSLDE
ncbi:Na/Pi cotransporter family protein [Nitrosomonas sp. Nm33]|uniref:Na/Pi cotransporter family protein n=1 Tax=Nitrosomonas sp. Nm33 TaxID=133724 RepID=UPI00089C16E1|nr:Na/Pi symporter [Nitrosomonas sp. Nm33]SDY61933.1 phosphate:Na+ symporter [Nitrosomonas sp. Nm33]